MGRIVADALEGDLDVVLVRKLGAPAEPELAIGSVDEHGSVYLYPECHDLWDDAYLQREVASQLAALHARRLAYGDVRVADPSGRIAIVIDDGIATGSTMIAALRSVRARHPSQLIAAAAVAAPQAIDRLESEADDVVVVERPPRLYAIGQFY